MDVIKEKRMRDKGKLAMSVILIWLYIPALVVFIFSRPKRSYVKSDLDRIRGRINYKMPYWLMLIYFLHVDRYFRCLFYYRIGPFLSSAISWIRPGDRYFIISKSLKMGKGCRITHPYSTILNAEEIGDNFSCIHLTTIGDSFGKRPFIGNNVSLGANVTIIGGVHIGDNVFVGAGSVVVKDVPSNCVIAGNPAKVIKSYNPYMTNE